MAENDIYTLAVKSRDAAGSLFVNTFGFREGAAVSGSAPAALAADFNNNILATYKTLFHSNLSVFEISVAPVWPNTGAQYILPVNPVQAGLQSSGDMLPPQDAAVVTWRTALGGRSYRGRSYVPPAGELQQAGGIWVSGYITSLSAWADALIGRYVTNATTSKFTLGVVSRVSGGVERGQPILTPVQTYTVRGTVRSMRRRQVGVGG